jgi:cation diffusion facilitator family transporter
VVSYEVRAARRLNSEVLQADAKHTRSDVLTSGAVLGALLGVWWGYPLLDPLAAILVAVFIGHAGWEIVQAASRILGDQVVIAEDDVRDVVRSVPDVLGCHQIRTRGPADHVFMDLHLWLDGNTTLESAHRTSHIVKDRLMGRFTSLRDVVIHIEPPPADRRPAAQAPGTPGAVNRSVW